jgi:glyoxylase-like metal-dependent hydrolase (beta-lactamase superfamily II)
VSPRHAANATAADEEQPQPSRLVPGVPSALSPLVRRVLAPNPGLMTGPGTNTYLVGIDEVAVIDPGPAVDSHIDAIIGASMRDRVRWVLLTHTHPDHWPAAARIREETGAVVAGFGKAPKADNFDLKLDQVLDDGSTIEGTEFRLEAMYTPGHAPNHLCFFLEEERLVFTGDHVLNGTTTVINPQRGGDMIQYLASLERLRKIKRLARLAPAHGEVIEDPKGCLEEYVAHRRMRERQILKLLQQGPTKIPAIVDVLYTETPEGLIEMAQRQVHAHLLKLKTEGKVQGSSVKGAWSLAD